MSEPTLTFPAPRGRPRGRPRRRTVVLAIVGVLVVALVGGLAWYFSPQPLLPEATAALASTAAATYIDDDAGRPARTRGSVEPERPPSPSDVVD
jgi:hypothetical protein